MLVRRLRTVGDLHVGGLVRNTAGVGGPIERHVNLTKTHTYSKASERKSGSPLLEQQAYRALVAVFVCVHIPQCPNLNNKQTDTAASAADRQRTSVSRVRKERARMRAVSAVRVA